MLLTKAMVKEISELVWDKPFSELLLTFCPNFLSLCCLNLVAYGEFVFQKFVTNQMFGWNFCVKQHVTYYLQQDYE